TFGAAFRVRNPLTHAIHTFFQERDFLYVQTPIITTSDCEGAGQMFGVTTLNLQQPPHAADGNVDWQQDFFAKPAYLTVSGQLEGEIFASAFSKVYTFGPTFRAEWGKDLQTEHERFLSEEVFKKPLIVTDYPKAIKAFYMRANDDDKTVRAMDVLVPRVGEIIGGSQREERLDVLLQRLRDA